MGIPVTWNIAREDAKNKDILRADLTGQRSPIRRRMRPSPSPRSRSAFDSDFLFSTSRFAPHLEPLLLSSHARTRLPPPPVPEVSRSAYQRSESSREPPSLIREERFRPSSTHIDGYLRAYDTRQSLDSDRSLPAFTPGFAPAASSHTTEEAERDERRARYLARLTGDFSRRHTSDSRPTRSRSPRAEGSASRPGDNERPADDGHESSDSNAVTFTPLRRMGRRTIADGPLPSSSLRESWSPVSTIDGLGDRERSLSPFGDNLPWDTFFSTVVPDPQVPTTDSSFASAAAAASFTAEGAASFTDSRAGSRAGSATNTSASSSQTHLTVPSRRHSPPTNDQFMRACDTSEDDTASDTEADDDDDTARLGEIIRLRYNPVALRRRSRPSFYLDETPRRDNERLSRRLMERSRDASSYVRSFYDSSNTQPRSLRGVMSSPHRASRNHEANDGLRMEQLDGTTEGPVPASDEELFIPISTSFPQPLDQELREARSLLERLSRREDLGDDFWASVGLSRSVADRVDSFNERERL